MRAIIALTSYAHARKSYAVLPLNNQPAFLVISRRRPSGEKDRTGS
jgi:hypothetical protein